MPNVTITGTYLDSASQPIRGRGYIEPTATVLTNEGGNLLVVEGIPFTLDTDGQFSVSVIATDDPSVSPSGFTYRLGFRDTNAVVYEDLIFQAPAAAVTIDIADITPGGTPLNPTQYAELDARLADSVTFSYPGAVTVISGTARLYNDTGQSRTIASVRASAGTAPTGTALIVDVRKNGTSIFPTTPRPQISVGANTGTAVPDTTTWAAGEYLSVDVVQVGSSVAGSDLTVTVTYK